VVSYELHGIGCQEFGLRPIGAYAYAPAGMRKIRKGAEGVCLRSNLILFVLVLVESEFYRDEDDEDEDDDEVCTL